MPASRFKMIHIEDPETKKAYPLMIKKYRTDKKKKRLVLSAREIAANAKAIPQYGGFLGALFKIIAPAIIGPAAGWAFGKLKEKIFGSGVDGSGIDPNQMPRMESFGTSSYDLSKLPFMAKVMYDGFVRGLKKKVTASGGRLYLGKGLKPAKMELEGPFDDSTRELYRIKNDKISYQRSLDPRRWMM